MKCRPLRRRYLLFRVKGGAGDSEIVGAIACRSRSRGAARLMLREGPYAVVRVDHLTASQPSLREPIPLGQKDAEMLSVSTTGSVRKAREKIKKLSHRDNAGDEEAVPVKQNDKMLIQ